MYLPKYIFANIILVLFAIIYLPIGEIQAIEISFSASESGESVGVWDSYDVDDSVSVKEISTANFGDLEMSNYREVSGQGSANMHQGFFGSGGGADWQTNNILNFKDANRISDESSALLRAASCMVQRNAFMSPMTLQKSG